MARFGKILGRRRGDFEVEDDLLEHSVNRSLPIHELFDVLYLLVYLVERGLLIHRSVNPLKN